MKLIKKLDVYGLLFFVIASCLSGSCKKDPNGGLVAPRIFKPSGLSIKTGETSAKITWETPLLSSGLQLTYTAEFSQDTTFASSEFALTLDTTGVTVTDDKLQIRKKYYVRIKANAYGDQPESKWAISPGFSITGEQLFLPIRDVEVKETSITLRWKPNPELTKIVLKPDGGASVDYPLSSSELSSGVKVITGLNAGVNYTAELFLDAKSKGILSFSTPVATVYSVILNPGDDLAAAITAAADNAVIGLNPGTYNASGAGFSFLKKTLTIKSTSGNPSDTKILFKEFTLSGTGAGLILSDVECDGTGPGGSYFINLTGAVSNSEIAAFTKVNINNCIIHGASTSFFRGDRGSNAGDYSMDEIAIKNCVIYDIGASSSYICFHLSKLQFNTMTVTKSTFYTFGSALFASSTVLPKVPVVTFDYCTFNNFGSQNKYVLVDVGDNPITVNIKNSIIGNVPMPAQSVQNAAIRANGAGSTLIFNNNNVFNFNNASGVALTFPSATTQIGNQSINLGWTSATTDFTLPAESVLRTVSNVGTAIGDPRWTY